MSSQNSGTVNIKELPGVISETKLWFVFPTINGQSEKGKKTYWTIMVGLYNTAKSREVKLDETLFDNPSGDLEDLIGIIRVESGYHGSVPKSSKDTRVTSGKNIGKANATNVFSQALRDAYGKYRVQLEKTQETEYIRPMLATDYNSLKTKPDWPLYIQCKFDGNRVMTHIEKDNTVLFYSRQMKPYTAISDSVYKNIIRLYKAAGQYFLNLGMKKSTRSVLFFDGEIYKHNASLQEHGILRRKKKLSEEDIEGFKYYMYDLYLGTTPDMPYSQRLKMLQEIYKILFKFLFHNSVISSPIWSSELL